MSPKVHFLHCYQERCPDNCCNVSDEQGERFHQNIKTIKECNQERLDKRIMADYCSSIKRDLNNIEHERQSRKIDFYHSSHVYEVFLSSISLLNDLRVNLIIFKTYCKNSISQ